MSALLVNARLIEPETGREGRGSLRIEEGAIAAVTFGDEPDAAGATRIDCGGLALAPGLVDVGVTVGEPGAAHLEDFDSAGRAAAAGGVTTIIVDPDCAPVCDDPAILDYRRRKAETATVRAAFLGALTKGLAGVEMAELGLMAETGAVGFRDGLSAMTDSRALRRALDYAAMLGRPVMLRPQEATLTAGAVATESEFSGRLGLPGAPAIAERIGLERDLALAELTGATLLADAVTTRGALEALSRRPDLAVAATTIHHVALNELDIAGYRSFFRLDPPLRAEADRAATAEAVADGRIAILRSAHAPWDDETKRVPFEAATPGAAGLETFLPAALTLVHAGLMDLPTLFQRIALAPARLFGLPGGRLAAGAPADLVLFDADAPVLLDRFALKGKSKNTPFDRRRMTGRVERTWLGGRIVHDRSAA